MTLKEKNNLIRYLFEFLNMEVSTYTSNLDDNLISYEVVKKIIKNKILKYGISSNKK